LGGPGERRGFLHTLVDENTAKEVLKGVVLSLEEERGGEEFREGRGRLNQGAA